MKISEAITSEFFTLERLIEHGFRGFPSGDFIISITDLQLFTKAINDKINELEET